MGSSASFNADVSIEYKVKTKRINELSECEEFLKKNPTSFYKETDIVNESVIRKLYEDKIDFVIDGEYESIEAKNCTLEETLEDYDDQCESYWKSIKIYRKATAEELLYVDLSLIKKYNTYSITEDYLVTVDILNTSSDIYYEADNSTGDWCYVEKYKELLSLPKAKIILRADGSCY